MLLKKILIVSTMMGWVLFKNVGYCDDILPEEEDRNFVSVKGDENEEEFLKKLRQKHCNVYEEVSENTSFSSIFLRKKELGSTSLKELLISFIKKNKEDGPLAIQKKQNDITLAKKNTANHFREDNEPVAPEVIKNIIAQSLKQPIESIFYDFDDTPIGVGSIAQVHKARLLNNNKLVAVKVLKPRTKQLLEKDIQLRLHKKKTSSYFHFGSLATDCLLKTYCHEGREVEVDLNQEAVNLELFAYLIHALGFESTVSTPKFYHRSNDVLVMEYISGQSVNKLSRERPYRALKLYNQAISFILRAIYFAGFQFGNCHLGNFLDKEDGTVCLIDPGIVDTFTKEQVSRLNDIYVSGNTFYNTISDGGARKYRHMCSEEIYRKYTPTPKLAGLHLSMMQYGESDSVCFLERAIIDSQAQALADYLNTSIAESSKIVSEELRGWYFFYANLAGIQNTINNQLHGLSKGRFCAGWIRHFQVLTQIGKGFYEIKQNCMLSGKALKEDLEQYKDSYTCELFPKTETSRLYHPLYQTMNERMLLNVDRTAIENAWRFSISKDSSITSNLFYAKKELMD